ncbi:MAG: hypothetical protein R3A51_10520 [Nannocystaceae bacterium]
MDHARSTELKAAYAYFMLRTQDLAAPGGIGVYVIPYGFLSGARQRSLRERVLLRHHLLAAFRLPSDLFPGAAIVVDVVFLRARGGELAAVDDSDAFILEGRYFDEHPLHVLGREIGKPGSGEKAFRYTVQGEFTGFPKFEPRPMCRACVVRPYVIEETVDRGGVVREREAEVADYGEAVRTAVLLGNRVEEFAAEVGARSRRAPGLWRELKPDLEAFIASSAFHAEVPSGNPHDWTVLARLRDADNSGATRFLTAFTGTGELVHWLAEEPRVEPEFRGRRDDFVAQATELFRRQRELELGQLMALHRQLGGATPEARILDVLTQEQGWMIEAADRRPGTWLEPGDVYLTGALWPKLDAVADRPGPQFKKQAAALRKRIGWVTFDDIPEVAPNLGWIPLTVVADWLAATIDDRMQGVRLVHKDGLVQLLGVRYEETSEHAVKGHISERVVDVIGWLNHDRYLFGPKDVPPGMDELAMKLATDPDRIDIGVRRYLWGQHWSESFARWVAADPERAEELAEHYNRTTRGYVAPEFEPVPLDISRWNPEVQLHDYQLSGVWRLLKHRSGLPAFGVGLGKTFTASASWVARQEWLARSPSCSSPTRSRGSGTATSPRVLPTIASSSSARSATSSPRARATAASSRGSRPARSTASSSSAHHHLTSRLGRRSGREVDCVSPPTPIRPGARPRAARRRSSSTCSSSTRSSARFV